MYVQVWIVAFLSTSILGDSINSEAQPDQSNNDKFQPYMDEAGKICQDKIEMIEDYEYEEQIHCKVQMQKSCHFINSQATSEDQACHTMYHRECETVYRPHMTKVNVRVCPNGAEETIETRNKPDSGTEDDNNANSKTEDDNNANSVVMDVRPSPPGMIQSTNCVNGRRKVCVTKYETECSTEMVEHQMTEDHPNCKVEMLSKCEESGKCRDVPAMRCRIEQRTVTKSKPETKCQRVPREFCYKEECKEVDASPKGKQNDTDEETMYPNCYFRQQIVNEVVPEEKCNYRPERVCHPALSNERMVRAMNGGEAVANGPRRRVCEDVPKEQCENKRINPKRVLKPMRKRICRYPRPNSTYDRRIMKKMKIDFPDSP